MNSAANSSEQPVGFPLPGWQPRPRPARAVLTGRFCRLEPLDPDRHAAELFGAYASETQGRLWTYLPYGPFASLGEYRAWMEKHWLGADPFFYAIVSAQDGRALGVASYLRIDPANGCIEIGHLAYGPALQRTPATTEVAFLLLRQAFELGYRRCEWKCDSLNAPSRAAAERFGFTFEGLFRQAVVVKGRNRDTAWYSIIDSEWPALRQAFEAWLAPENFDAQGHQRKRLAAFRPQPPIDVESASVAAGL